MCHHGIIDIRKLCIIYNIYFMLITTSTRYTPDRWNRGKCVACSVDGGDDVTPTVFRGNSRSKQRLSSYMCTCNHIINNNNDMLGCN